MMRRLYKPLIIIALWIFTISGLSNAQPNEPEYKIPLFNQMAQKAEAQGNIRVIVQLAVPDIETATAASAQIKTGPADASTIVKALSMDGLLAARIASTADDLINRTGLYGMEVHHRYSAFPLLALEVSPDMLRSLAQDPQVLHITEDHLARPHLNNTVDIIGATGSWDSGYTGSDWYIAILDTGIRSSHEFFSGKDIVEACFSTAGHCPNNATTMTGVGSAAHHPSSYYGWDHGTHVSGIAAGSDDPNLDGVAKDAGILAVQIYSRFNTPTECGATTPCVLAYNSDILAGLNYIYSLRTAYNIAAVNLSLGYGHYMTACDDSFVAYKTAIDQLRSAGIPTVAAAGNDGSCGGITAPGCISTAIAVGATTDADVMASFSNYNENLVDLFAPGASINSAVADSDASYQSWFGTSMAAPHVSGAFALLRQANETATVAEMLTALKDTGETANDSANCGDSGTLPVARVHVENALNPAAPDNLAVTAISWDEIALSWNDNSNTELGFKIDRKTGTGGTFSEIADVAADTTTYDDTDALTEGTTYYYRVRAHSGVGNSPYSSEANTSTLLAAPSSVVATAVSDTQINLTWADNSSAESGYEVDRGTSVGSFSQIASLAADTITFSDPGLSPGTTYYYRLRSTNGTIASLYIQTNTRTTGGSSGSSGGGCFISVTSR